MSLAASITGAAAQAPARSLAETAGSGIRFRDVSVVYGATTVLDCLTLEVEPGEILALIGPSGSGKTTALRVVAGFVRPASGRVSIGDDDVTELPPYARGLGMVVQNYALFPHMRVDQNVAFGLRAQKAAAPLIAERVAECLAIVGMSHYARRYPAELSGGQQQRVAIARALAIRPRVLLLDEPLSALDAQIRRNMVEELARLHRDLPNLTVLYVTHDQSEALTLADRIAIMKDGRLNAFGPARRLYQTPPSRFAAEFLGRANLLPVGLEGFEPGTDLLRARFGDARLLARGSTATPPGSAALLVVRPHALRLATPLEANAFKTRVANVLWQGEAHHLTLDASGTPIRLTVPPALDPPRLDSELWVRFAAEEASLIPDTDDG
jgi:2-aminoethylphosphonate transport system ATP-binding protein